MNRLINTKKITLLALMVFTLTPLFAVAADMWTETPNLDEQSGDKPAVTGPSTFKYSNPAVDMWAETPDLKAEGQLHDVKIDLNSRLVSNFIPEMYAETPDLNQAFAESQVKILDGTVIAEK
jgi:hypothetical protein